jgi:succinate dehydrogenase/fumarate reductase flavoprotein subunit
MRANPGDERRMADKVECDVLVAGSGASGFTAAITAHVKGLDVLMVEKEPLFGGTTAYSAGVIWIPDNEHARKAGLADSKALAMRYLQSVVGNRLNAETAQAFIDNASPMLAFMEANSHARYLLQATWADYNPKQPGGVDGGRSLLPEPFDGRKLGVHFRELRPPIKTMMIFGGMMVGRDDLPHLFAVTKSVRSAVHVGGLVARYAKDRLRYPRGTRISNGNALIGRLALTAFERDIPLWLSSPVKRLLVEGGRISGALVDRDGIEVTVIARRGVVLACGGFTADEALKARTYAHMKEGKSHVRLAPAGNTGDGIKLAQTAGGQFHENVHHAAAWTPVSLAPQRDGTVIPFPHFIDRGKPGVICVDRRGRRFVNEALSYHEFQPAMVEASRGEKEIACWIVCDHKALRKFGLGVVPPAPLPFGSFLRSGYLKSGRTPGDLARAIGIDAAGLAETIVRYNGPAARGEDPELGKGGDAYQHFNGAANHDGPNPCVAPLETPPFYAVRLVPSDLGTFAGLRTDRHARVLDAGGAPIAGLYAVGNDMASVMGGQYPGAGITIGPGMTFGYIAACHLAEAVQTVSAAAG